MIRMILVPLDGSTYSERALPVALELVQAFKAQLVLVCVAGTESALPKMFTSEDRNAISEQNSHVKEEEHLLSIDLGMIKRAQMQVRAVAEAERYLNNIAAPLAGLGIQSKTAVPYGSVVKGILTEIDLYKADLVVMCAHGASGLNQLIGGSVTLEILTHSPVPVLLVPPRLG